MTPKTDPPRPNHPIANPDMQFTSVPVRVPPDMNREQWRWWFAGQAMAGLLADSNVARGKNGWPRGGAAFNNTVSKSACEKADALLAELERTSP